MKTLALILCLFLVISWSCECELQEGFGYYDIMVVWIFPNRVLEIRSFIVDSNYMEFEGEYVPKRGVALIGVRACDKCDQCTDYAIAAWDAWNGRQIF